MHGAEASPNLLIDNSASIRQARWRTSLRSRCEFGDRSDVLAIISSRPSRPPYL